MVTLDSKLSHEVCELLYIKRIYINELKSVNIAGHQDDIQKANELSFPEEINM